MLLLPGIAGPPGRFPQGTADDLIPAHFGCQQCFLIDLLQGSVEAEDADVHIQVVQHQPQPLAGLAQLPLGAVDACQRRLHEMNHQAVDEQNGREKGQCDHVRTRQ